VAHQGKFIVLEGIDGSGKGTQFKLLVERLKSAGYDVATFDFPRYEQESSYFVRRYLNGAYGSADQVGPYTGSLFYALDRYEAASDIRQALADGKIVLANRFTGSNMAHQGTKFRSPEERRGYFIWLDNLEFQMLNIPRPDMNMVLRVPAEIAQTQVDKKDKRDYTDKQRDIHEADLSHLQRSAEVYDDLCNLFPKDFTRIDCVRSDKLLDTEAVHSLLWEKIHPQLPKPSKKRSVAATTQSGPTKSDKLPESESYTKQLPSGTIITNAGYEYLSDVVTSVSENVYAFTSKLDPASIATALARFCRGNRSLRLTILEEFSRAADMDESVSQSILADYGDESVKQLVNVQLVVEGASDLLIKKLEWGRLATYVEQSPRGTKFEERDEHGSYRYFIPSYFDATTKNLYCDVLDQIFETYSEMLGQLTKHLAIETGGKAGSANQGAAYARASQVLRATLPVATRSTVGVFASAQSVESLIIRLLADDLPEANAAGDKLLEAARQVIPTFLSDVDRAELGGAVTAYRANTAKAVQALVQQHLPTDYAADSAGPVTLTDIWPRNELDLVPDMLYEHTDRALGDIREAVTGWDYDQKLEAFQAYIGERFSRRHYPGRALEKARYSWDLVTPYAVFRNLQRHRMVDDLEWQKLTPRFGYDVPKLVDEAGLTELFEKCFDLSLRLYSSLQQAGYSLEAQYATLYGHNLRWKLTVNARQAMHLIELHARPDGNQDNRKLVLEMHDKIATRHPLLAEAMRFVAEEENDELMRRAVESSAQFKLKDL